MNSVFCGENEPQASGVQMTRGSQKTADEDEEGLYEERLIIFTLNKPFRQLDNKYLTKEASKTEMLILLKQQGSR